jgi:hypothetical protein
MLQKKNQNNISLPSSHSVYFSQLSPDYQSASEATAPLICFLSDDEGQEKKKDSWQRV